ncbi:MAG: hypothetical protein HY701_10120, partial [Gemmatimonadetes bacterium]|nr:hypothetical protein [Gemmatimonadota bacterium]
MKSHVRIQPAGGWPGLIFRARARSLRSLAGWAIGLVLTVFTAAPLAGQGWIEPRPEIIRDFGVVKLRTHVGVRVVGRVAHVEVEEWFQNRGGGLGEGDYLYPLPGEAVFANFSLFQGDLEL